MMQQELCYQPNFGKVTALSISRRVVAVTIRIRGFLHIPAKGSIRDFESPRK